MSGPQGEPAEPCVQEDHQRVDCTIEAKEVITQTMESGRRRRVGKGAWHGSRKIRGLSRLCPRGRDSPERWTAWAKTRKAGRKPANACHAPLSTLHLFAHLVSRLSPSAPLH